MASDGVAEVVHDIPQVLVLGDSVEQGELCAKPGSSHAVGVEDRVAIRRRRNVLFRQDLIDGNGSRPIGLLAKDKWRLGTVSGVVKPKFICATTEQCAVQPNCHSS